MTLMLRWLAEVAYHLDTIRSRAYIPRNFVTDTVTPSLAGIDYHDDDDDDD